MNSPSRLSSSNLIELLLFEVIERIAIFHLHLEETDTRFFPPRVSNSSEPHFVDRFNECLSKMLNCTTVIRNLSKEFGEDQDRTRQIIQVIGEIISAIKKLHNSYLGHLPRPPEPPELKRFGRILQKYVVKLKDSSRTTESPDSVISIYLGETETAYAGDPLSEFQQNDLNEIIKKINSNINGHIHNSIDLFIKPIHDNLGYHLTVPRIDSTNPCRWPILVHEVGHRIMDHTFFKTGDIQKDFEELLSSSTITLPDYINKFDLKSWLTECWCDLFGVVVIGPSFWFSQWSSFLFNSGEEGIFEGNITHPPALFRLHLIRRILNHRFPSALSPEFKHAAFEAKQLLEEFDRKYDNGFLGNTYLRHLVLLFQDYFVSHFFRQEDGEIVLGENTLNDKFSLLIKYTKIEKNVIDSMVKSLSKGFPIPSVQVADPQTWRERPSTVQEILLSAWLYRNTAFRNDVLDKYNDILNRNGNNPGKIWDEYADEIVKMFRAFNFSVLRSIQIGEWFHLYEGGDRPLFGPILSKANNVKENNIRPDPSVIVDYQIFNLIREQEIRVIPIMRFDKQLGATSLDIRLGTSFQVYSPNQVGVFDLTDQESIDNANANSILVDLDYLQSITIAPGQFMLGHSMEYICLPPSVAAQVEGRSSFARLGIEVHMTAGFVDPGFQGVLTFEIFNAGPNPVRLYPGIRIGQLRFFWGSPPGKPYNQNPAAKYRGLLQHRNSLQFQDYEVQLLTDEVKNKAERRGY